MAISTVQEIAYTITTSMQVNSAISGAMIDIVESNRQFVANYTNETIAASGIPTAYQGAIFDFARADAVDLINAQPGGEDISLGELRISEGGDALSAQQYRQLGEMKLKAIGRSVKFSRSLS